jgi:hypothetical protein
VLGVGLQVIEISKKMTLKAVGSTMESRPKKALIGGADLLSNRGQAVA